jgi:hypothetical protein
LGEVRPPIPGFSEARERRVYRGFSEPARPEIPLRESPGLTGGDRGIFTPHVKSVDYACDPPGPLPDLEL